jgi:signal transduction histidine kinase
MFEPFFSTKGEGKGTGLGLFISRNIIMEHQGQIEASSREGEGTLFTIFLPLEGAAAGGGDSPKD